MTMIIRSSRQPTPRLLVLRALGLGDLLTGVPALRALRRAFPGHEIVLAAPAGLVGTVSRIGAVDRLLSTRAGGRDVPDRIDWTGAAPDIAVDLHGGGPASHDLLRQLDPGRLFGFAHPATPYVDGPPWRADEHERVRWCRLLEWYRIRTDPEDLRIAAPAAPSPAAGAVVLHPGADAPARRWPAERFGAVGRALQACGHRVVVTAGPDEHDLAAAVADHAGLIDRDVYLDPPLDLLAALVGRAHALIVGDTGPAHLATALGTPSVVLFGPVAPQLWGPPELPRHRALWPADPGSPLHPGDPHGERPDPRLLRITVPDVLDAFAVLPVPATVPVAGR
jgi:ADP-heptose:LPS heptosyltransferase